ncbi:MAG: cation-translocating P-type ATPase, partial [Desulfovibrionaceae bacterium]|nr:cation-translocating P-type ATPase [Desulfovibrionaceae bacterium]
SGCLLPCALVLSTPTAIMAGIGNATRFGALISSGDALERMARINRMAFDKTGTITYGRPEVIGCFSRFCNDAALLKLAAALEQQSEHPLGKAITRHTRKLSIMPALPENFRAAPGRGVTAEIDGVSCFGGTMQLMNENKISTPPEVEAEAERYLKKGSTVVYFAEGHEFTGFIALADTLRPEARETIARLKALNVSSTLLTGDNQEAAGSMAASAGIDDVQAGLLPEDKVNIIKDRLQAGRGDKVCMVGDGINDAPALKSAYVGIAMGDAGSDIAVDAADAVLVRDDIAQLPHLIALARKTDWTIRVNIAMSLGLNLVTVLLAALGLMGPALGALAHNAGAVLIVLNSVRLLRWRYQG